MRNGRVLYYMGTWGLMRAMLRAANKPIKPKVEQKQVKRSRNTIKQAEHVVDLYDEISAQYATLYQALKDIVEITDDPKAKGIARAAIDVVNGK